MGWFICAAVLQFAICAAFPSMRAVRKTGVEGCTPPGFSCVSVVNITTPEPGFEEVLIKVSASGVNPDEITILDLPAVHYTLGIDVAGIVASVGSGTTGRIKVGDRVWANGIHGGMGEYAIRSEALCGKVPQGLDLVGAGTLPTVAMTSLGALRSAGAPWKMLHGNKTSAAANMTVLITAGTGGTGYTAVQLAKALGASRVVTAATGNGIAFAKMLGADIVVDYEKGSVFDAVADGSIDVVLSNHKSNTSAARAMTKLKPVGVYVTLDGDTTANPPPGVQQIDYDLFDPKEAIHFVEYLDEIAAFLAAGKMQITVDKAFGFAGAKDALNMEAQGLVLSKVAVVPVLQGTL
jgi:NADPH:quinone reductase-like Zn-dependent oxidoreductase